MRVGFCVMLLLLSSSDGRPRFVEVGRSAGLDFQHASGSASKDYILETIGSGAAWLDYDRDGWMDLYLVNGGDWQELKAGRRSASNALFRNLGDGTFSEVTRRAGVGGRHWGMGATAADFDNDGWTDLFIVNYGPNSLFRNRGDGSFDEIAEKAGVASTLWGSSAAFGDYDGDGWLDLYVTNYVRFDHHEARPPECQYRGIQVHCGPKGLTPSPDRLYHNNRDGTFSDVSEASGIARVEPAYGLGVSWLDFDEDGDADLFVANDSMPNYLFLNQGAGRFEEVGLLSGFAYSQDGNAQAGMGIATGDYDRDGQLDLYLTHFSDDYNTLYRNSGEEMFRDQSYPAQLAFPTWQYLGWGTFFFDFDNDGWLDLFVANGHIYPQVDSYQIGTAFRQRNQLFANLGNGKFREVTGEAGPALETVLSSRGAAYADFDNDGDLDLVVNNLDSRPSLLRNEGGNRAGHWVSFALEGTSSNRSAVGARVGLVTAQGKQVQELQAGSSYQSSHDPRLHFGLGTDTRVSELTVRWPSGARQTFRDLAADRWYFLREGSEPVGSEAAPNPMSTRDPER